MTFSFQIPDIFRLFQVYFFFFYMLYLGIKIYFSRLSIIFFLGDQTYIMWKQNENRKNDPKTVNKSKKYL